MPRKFGGPLRKWAQVGGRQGYTASLLSRKARQAGNAARGSEKPDHLIRLDSLSALAVFLLLEWRADVVSIVFEGRRFRIPDRNGKRFSYLADFIVILLSGAKWAIEAKGSRKALKEKVRERLLAIERHFSEPTTRENFELIFREDLVASWQLPILQLVRPFGFLEFPPDLLREATERLATYPTAAGLREWRLRAHAVGVKTSVLYYLLYHQHLQLEFGPVYPEDLTICLDWSASS